MNCRSDFILDNPGKGQSVWMTMGYILSKRMSTPLPCTIATSSITDGNFLPGCSFPCPSGHGFRVQQGLLRPGDDKLYGRVTRLFYTPLIRTLRRIIGFNAFLSYLDNFRYALSGEFALITHLARGIRISPTWGLEVSLLSEIYQRASINRICQVEIMDTYEHKHQILEKGRPSEGLIRMATDIAKALLRVLSQDGTVMSEAFFRTMLTAYMQEARLAIEKYHGLSMINGLVYDRHGEIEAVESFVGSIRKAIDEFVKDPVVIPMIAAWVRVIAAIPDFEDRISEAVDLDNA